MLVPWNAVLSTMVFFKDELPGTNISFMISFAMNGIMVFIVIAIVFFSADKIANRFLRVHLVFLCTAPILMTIPVIVHESTKAFTSLTPTYWITFFLLLIVGMGHTVPQAYSLSWIALLPEKYMGACSFGMGLSSLILNFTEAIFIAAGGSDETNERKYIETNIYYAIAGAILVITAALYFVERDSPFAIYYC